ncbi:MAG: SIMPL domain-containing protein [Candidatus Micrarchaeota archaeon]|nr:SIMPL domain-containing protein [Candidatus Micrarchaeota archaeon]
MAKQDSNNGPVYAGAAVLIVLIVMFGLVFSGALKGGSFPQPTGSLSSVSISASGTAKGVPSRADIYLFVNATGNSTAAATANLSSRMAEFNSTVYSYVNGNMSLVKTSYYNVGVPYQVIYPYKNTSSNSPYEAQESITVTLPQIARLNGFLANITSVPGLEVQDVSAILSDSQVAQLRQQALQSALANATTQARSIIGNVKVINTTISVNSYYAVPYPLYAASASGGVSRPQGNLYYNGTTSVYESIQATFYYRK